MAMAGVLGLRYERFMNKGSPPDVIPTELPLSVWTTGAPVPLARRAKGSFFDMITRRAEAGFGGVFLDVHTTRLESRADCEAMLGVPTCGVIVTGSPALLDQDEEWMKWTMEALTRMHARRVPILGICFGHQLLGQALGGRVERNPKGREIGTYALQRLGPDPLLDGLSSEPIVVMTHLDSVVAAPSSAQVIASTPLEPNAALRFSDTTWGVQFHPEMDAETVGYYMTERKEAIQNEGIDIDGLFASRRDSPFGRELLVRFASFCAANGQFP